MAKIGIIGPESTGKTTLAKWLAVQSGGRFVAEYAREYVEKLHTPYTFSDVESIAKTQIQQLCEYDDAKDIFYDTELIITKVWFQDKYNVCPDFLVDALQQNLIDFYLICAPDLPAVDDPVRENLGRREELFRWYKQEVEQSGSPYRIVEGTGDERFKNALCALDRYRMSRKV